MLRRCSSSDDVKRIIEYLGDRYKASPYLYANIIKYGWDNPNVPCWIHEDESDEIIGCYLKYYDCMHFYTRDAKAYPAETLVEMLKMDGVFVSMVPGEMGEIIETMMGEEYFLEKNHVIDMDKVGIQEDHVFEGEIATEDDIDEIAELLLMDEIYTGVYFLDELKQQYHERFRDGFSRFFIERVDGVVAAACSTYGEVEGFALVGGVIVHPGYRRRGLAAKVEDYCCHILEEEGVSRVGFVNFENHPSLALHESLGAFSCATLYKFVKEK